MVHNYKVNNNIKINDSKILGYIRARYPDLVQLFGEPKLDVDDKIGYQWIIMIGEEPLYDSSAHYIFSLNLIIKTRFRIVIKEKISLTHDTLLWQIHGYTSDAVKVLANILQTTDYTLRERK